MTMWSDSSSKPIESSTRDLSAQARIIRVGSAALLCESASVFERIFDADISLCIWNRWPDAILAAYLPCTLGAGSWERMARVDPRDPDVERLLCDFEEGVGKVRLLTELTGLVDLMATLTDARSIGVRMIATRERPCPRFHVDRVGVRLLCTWHGDGTEWLTHEDVIREQLGHQRAGGSEVQRPGARIWRMKPFSVGLFKGELWPGNAGRGAVHRSPRPWTWRVMVSLDAL